VVAFAENFRLSVVFSIFNRNGNAILSEDNLGFSGAAALFFLSITGGIKLSYRGRREGAYGQTPRRSSNPTNLYYKRGITRGHDGYAVPRFPVEDTLQSEQAQGAKQSLELWLKALPSLTSSGFAFKFSPSSEDLEEDARALVKLSKKSPESEVRDPKTKKTIKLFKILRLEEADPFQAQTMTLEGITDDQVRRYIGSLKTQLEPLGYTILEVLN
jgi:hypothetical protein